MILLICGCARSGTTILAHTLNKHPDIALGIERYIALKGNLTPDLFEPEAFFDETNPPPVYCDFSHAEYEVVRPKFASAKIVGDKVPRLYRKLEPVLERIPDAKVIFIYRNVFDVAASWQARASKGGKHWDATRDARSAIFEWNESLRTILPFVEAGKVLPVSYESLFIEGEGWDAVSEYLGVDIPPMPAVAKEPSRENGSLCSRDITKFAQVHYYRLLEKERLAKTPLTKDKPPHAKPSGQKYLGDYRMVKYEYEKIPDVPIQMRLTNGKPLPDPADVVVLGSAASFGRFCSDPWAAQLESKLNINVANLSSGGARPETYLQFKPLMEKIAAAKTTIIEMTSARGYENRVFTPRDYQTTFVFLKGEWKNFQAFHGLKEPIFVDHLWRRLFDSKEYGLITDMVSDLRESYVRDMQEIANTAQKAIFLHFAQKEVPNSFGANSYTFPQMVDKDMMDAATKGHELVKVVSQAGLPQDLLDAETGEPLCLLPNLPIPTQNSYYPSPEMHNLTAKKLIPVLKKALKL